MSSFSSSSSHSFISHFNSLFFLLKKACKEGNLVITIYILLGIKEWKGKGKKENIEKYINLKRKHQIDFSSIMDRVCKEGFLDIVKLLIEEQWISASSRDLCFASRSPNSEIFRYLLQFFNSQSSEITAVFCLSIYLGKENNIHILLDTGKITDIQKYLNMNNLMSVTHEKSKNLFQKCLLDRKLCSSNTCTSSHVRSDCISSSVVLY